MLDAPCAVAVIVTGLAVRVTALSISAARMSRSKTACKEPRQCAEYFHHVPDLLGHRDTGLAWSPPLIRGELGQNVCGVLWEVRIPVIVTADSGRS